MDLFAPGNYYFNAYAIGPAVVGLGIAALGLAVLIREQWSALSMAFFGITAAGALWLLGYVGVFCATRPEVALQWARIENIGVAFIPTMVFLFTLSVARKLRRFRAYALGAVLISSMFCFFIVFTPIFVTGVKQFFWGHYKQYGLLSYPFLAFFATLLIFSFRIFRFEYLRSAPGTQRRRIGLFMAAFGIAYLGSVDFLAAFDVPLYPFGYIPVLLFLGITANVIWRYRLVEITPAFAAAQILKTVSDALLVFDQDGVIRVANRAACDLFERPESQLVGQPIWRVDRNFFPRERFDAFIRTHVIHNYEAVFTASRGRKTVLDVAVSGIRDDFGEPAAVVCVARDLTERKMAEDELRRVHDALKKSHQDLQAAQMQLIQAAKMESVGRLAAGIAHEVKNPLAVILQGFEYLDKHMPQGDPNVLVVLQAGKEAVRRADQVLRGLLDFSALKTLELAPVSLNEVAEQALLLVKYSLDAARIQVVRKLDEGLPPLVLDRNKTEQVIVNLLINAVHAMPGSGTLSITTRSEPPGTGETAQRVILEVEDTGGGIPQELLPKIFDPFFTTKPTGKGTGLGLTVAKSLVELQGGTIDLRNRPEGGVKATLTFRRAEQRSAKRKEENPTHR